MAEYYLISQLPSLDGISDSTPLPITQQYFFELCSRFLNKEALDELESLTLVPPLLPQSCSSALIEAWNEGERDLRLALAGARAEKMGKLFDMHGTALPPELIRAAAAAVDTKDPLEAEKYLLQYRLRFLETLRPMDAFCKDYIFYYGLKLKLLLRIRQFDAKLGEEVYRNIYNSILNGDKSEATR